LIGAGLCALILALIAVALLRAGVRLTLAPMTVPMVALVLYAFLLLPRTPLPTIMIERPASWLLGLAVMAAVQASLQLGARASHWEDALLAGGTLISVVSGLAVVLWFRDWSVAVGSGSPPIGFRLPGVLVGHPNVIAGYLDLLLPLVVVRLLTPRKWLIRILLGLVLALFLIAEYFASSRGGWLGGAAGIAVCLALLAWPWARKTLVGFWRRSRARTAGAVVLSAVALAGAVLGTYAILGRQASRTYHAPVASARSEIWGPAVQIIRDSPIVGHGVGAFVVRFAEATRIPPGFSTNHAHNLILQILAETGAVGLLLALAAVALGVWGIWPAIRRAFSQADAALAASLGAFTALLVHHSVDYLFNVTPYLLAVMTLIALAVSHPLARRQASIPGWPVGGSLLAAAVVVVGIAVWSARGMSFRLSGLQSDRQSDPAGASEALCLAAQEAPDISLFGFQCALATASEAAASDDPALLEAAVNTQRLVLARDPYWPIHLANLAGLEWAAGQHDQAVADLKAAADRAPRDALLLVNLGWMLEQQGREPEALDAYRQALAYDPLLPGTPFFAATQLRRQAESSFVPAQAVSDSDLLVAEARETISAGRADGALPLLNQAVAANPRSARALAWRAKALADIGQSDEAWRDVRTAIFIDSDSVEALALGAVIAEQTGRMQEAFRLGRTLHETLEAASLSASYYAELYRRPYLPYDMVPQLIRAVPTGEMLAALELAATSYEQRGEEDKASAVRAWMLEK
jgi:O-antigen ligase/Flp pilus assembly protein TadD